ncbi:MAG: hypothetical protein U0P45_05510 [Acidimicrobiales bacterium]
MTRRALALPCALAMAVLAGACTGSSVARYLDVPGQSSHPLTADGRYGFGIWEHPKGQAYTVSVVVYATHRLRAHIESVRPVARSSNIEVLGSLAAGPERHFGQAGGSHGFPPANLPRWAATTYRPVRQVVVTTRKVDGLDGVDLLIGIRLRSGHRGWIDGIEVTFVVEGKRYAGRFPVSAGLCDYHPCPMPAFGPPWDGAP